MFDDLYYSHSILSPSTAQHNISPDAYLMFFNRLLSLLEHHCKVTTTASTSPLAHRLRQLFQSDQRGCPIYTLAIKSYLLVAFVELLTMQAVVET
jgi:hypothetical protein